MVRTYAYNPSTQGSFFDSVFTNPSTICSSSQQSPQQQSPQRATKEVQRQDNEIVPVRQQIAPTERCLCNVGPPQYSNAPFHSPYVDPIGSIVGLRVLYLDGKLCYVPVEPQLNYMINQQFGNGFCVHCARRNGFLSMGNDQIHNQASYKNSNGEVHPADPVVNNGYQEKYAIDSRTMYNPTAGPAVQNPQRIRQSEDDGPPWTVQHPQPRSGVRRSSLWFGGETVQVTSFEFKEY
ncbi:hypothetical protein OSTOST_01013 [Ostertagia ostertagi]